MKNRLQPMMALVLATAILSACGNGDEGIAPERRMPELGVYAYHAIVETTDSTADTLSGSVTLTYAHPDSILAQWSVPGFSGQRQRGSWNVNAYVLPAYAASLQGTLNHRIWRNGSARELGCRSSYERVLAPADTFRSSRDCSLSTGN